MAPIRWIIASALIAYLAAFFAGGAAIGGVIDAFSQANWQAQTARWLFRPEMDSFVATLRALWAATLYGFSLLLGPGAAAAASLAGVPGATPPPFAASAQAALALLAPLALFALRSRAMGARSLSFAPRPRLDAISVVASAAIALLYAGASLYFLASYALEEANVFEQIRASLQQLRRYDGLVAIWVPPAVAHEAEGWAGAAAKLTPAAQAAPGLFLWALVMAYAALRAARALRVASRFPYLYVTPELQPQQ